MRPPTGGRELVIAAVAGVLLTIVAVTAGFGLLIVAWIGAANWLIHDLRARG